METVTVRYLSEVLGISVRRIQQLVQEQIIHAPQTHGRYDAASSVTGYIRYLRTQADTNGGELTQERCRLIRAKREKIELCTAKLRGELVPAADVSSEWQSMVTCVRDRLLAIPDRAAPLLVAKDEHAIERTLRDMVWEALDELVADRD